MICREPVSALQGISTLQIPVSRAATRAAETVRDGAPSSRRREAKGGDSEAAGGYLDLRAVSKRYAQTVAVQRVSLSVERGEIVTLLGPSGCGKTTTLNMVAGFLTPDEGEIWVAGRPVTSIPTHRRNMGMVFQSYALFPHLTVYENVAFGLRMRRYPDVEIRQRVSDALDLVRLPQYLGAYPRHMSGGEQQRVALARALVIKPTLLLLDEPLSNLDAKLRIAMRAEIRAIMRQAEITALFVTHDQEEALAISDRVAVMNRGLLLQVGTPTEIYRDPANLDVARFVGDSNQVVGTFHNTSELWGMVLTDDGLQLPGRAHVALSPGTRVTIVIRPEDIRLCPIADEPDGLRARVREFVFLGGRTQARLSIGRHELITNLDHTHRDMPAGAECAISWRASDALIFASD